MAGRDSQYVTARPVASDRDLSRPRQSQVLVNWSLELCVRDGLLPMR